MLDSDLFFYVPGGFTCVDQARKVDDAYVGYFSGETLEQLNVRYPGAVLCDYATMKPQIDAAMAANFVRPPVEITKEQFWDALEVLPPLDWRNDGVSESFKLRELTCGSYTNIYARIGEKYFNLADDVSTPHAFIINKCQQVAA